jgi:3-oxoacyl-[acyl-carrier-protein] synthase II
MSPARVAITGVGIVTHDIAGGFDRLAAWLSSPRDVASEETTRLGQQTEAALDALLDEGERRRLSRISRLAVTAAKLAVADAGLVTRADRGTPLGLVFGTELGDLRSTMQFADGYLERGPVGLSALLFPSTVMNTMAAATAIAVSAREASLTLNAPVVAGELAVARAAAAIAGGRLAAVLAGGVDEFVPIVRDVGSRLGAGRDARGEGATVLVLEPMETARERGATILGEIVAARWSSLRARPCRVGDTLESRAIPAALDAAGMARDHVAWTYTSVSQDEARAAWQERLLATALPARPRSTSLAPWLGRHAGTGVFQVAAAAWTARSGCLPCAGGNGNGRTPGTVARVPAAPGLVHAVARGGSEVALIVGGGHE